MCLPCEEHYEAAVDESGYDAGCKFCRNGFYSAGGVDAVCKPCPVNFTSSNGSGCHLGDGKIWPVRASGYCKPGQYVPANLSFQFVLPDGSALSVTWLEAPVLAIFELSVKS